MGDSQAESLSGYEILNDANVAAKISQRVKNSDEQINKAISAKTPVVFMTYGVNDMGMYSSGDEFAEQYAKKLEKLKSGACGTLKYMSLPFFRRPILPQRLTPVLAEIYLTIIMLR